MRSRFSALFRGGIRLQLTLWYTAIFGFLLFGAGLFFYQHLKTSLADSVDSNLHLRTQQLARDVRWVNTRLVLDDDLRQLPGFDTDINDKHLATANADFDVFVRLLDAQGRPLHETPAFRRLHMPSISAAQSLQSRSWQGTIVAQDGQQIRLLSQTLIEEGKPFAIIQIGQSLEDLHEMLRRVVRELLLMGGFVLLVGAIGSYWLAARAMVPIKQLAQTARMIQGGDLRQRVQVPGARDEVHFLAVTLNEMIASLEQMFAQQRRFVADASHELRTPVAAIRSKTEIALLRNQSAGELQIVIRDINAETERLSALITDLLTLARGDEGQTHFEQEPVRLDLLAHMVGQNAQPLADLQQLALEVQADDPVMVRGDEARLIQVIMNLLDNALCYTDAGGHITLTVCADTQHARLLVCDTGIGIAPHHLPHLFERFYRVDPSRTHTEGNNSGLGLSLVEWIVTAHGGSVSVESQIGVGSVFTVLLPRLQTSENKQISKKKERMYKETNA